MDYDKILAYLVALATVINLLTGSVKNIDDMRKDKKKKRRTPAKKKRRN